jgi:hypothetical protein
MKFFTHHIKLSLLCLLIVFTASMTSPAVSNAQVAPGYPSNKNELAQRIFSNWAQLSSKTVDGILFSDTNTEVRRFVEAILIGESPAVLDSHLRNMKLDESTQERILIELINELRKDPKRLIQLSKDINEFTEYKPFADAKTSLGSGIFNSSILAIDFTAIWFGTAGAMDSLSQDFLYGYQGPTILTAVMMLIGSGIVAEVINMKRTAGDLVREWKKKRKKGNLAKKMREELSSMSVFYEDELNGYRVTNDIEKATSELLPHLISKMNKDAQTSWRARRKQRSFTKRLRSNFSIEELDNMGLFNFKSLSKLEKLRLRVPLFRWFIKEVAEHSMVDVSNRDSYRRALSKLSSLRLELRDTTRKSNFFLLNNFSIGMITVASAIQGLSLAVNTAAPGVINFDSMVGQQLYYLKHYEPIVTILTLSSIALSLDFQGMFNSSRKRDGARRRRIDNKEQLPILEQSLRKES